VALRSAPQRRLTAPVGVAGIGAGVLGAAPHVLHHVGPLAGAAVLAGTTGTLLFGALGLVAATPMLLRMHRRSGSWRSPLAALTLFAALFALSTTVIGPALTGSDDTASDSQRPPSAPAQHDSHHK
jgi:hypothetical protein